VNDGCEDLHQYPQYTAPETWRQRENTTGLVNLTGLPVSNSSLALEQFRVIKAGPGTLFGLSVYSNKASAQFIQIFDAITAPASGAVPVFVATVGATGNLGLYWGSVGRWFNIGIVVANSSTPATQTAGSQDCFYDGQYF